jgi:hypothetical protein
VHWHFFADTLALQVGRAGSVVSTGVFTSTDGLYAAVFVQCGMYICLELMFMLARAGVNIYVGFKVFLVHCSLANVGLVGASLAQEPATCDLGD